MYMWTYKRTNDLCVGFTIFFVLFLALMAEANANSKLEKNYLRIQQTNSNEIGELKISSIGALAFKKDKAGHIDLSYLESDTNGDALTLDFGGGHVFNWDLSLFVGFGISLGYNNDNNDYIAAYYPEASVVLDVTNTFGILASIKRYHYLYRENDAVIMVGLVFR